MAAPAGFLQSVGGRLTRRYIKQIVCRLDNSWYKIIGLAA